MACVTSYDCYDEGMTISDRISFLWDKAYTDALGAGHADPFEYADKAVAQLSAHLRRVENHQKHPNGFARPNQAGCRQAAERRSR